MSVKFKSKLFNSTKMQSLILRHVPRSMRSVGSLRFAQSIRCLATVKDIFPNKVDFPSRHIGPRKTDVVEMLDLLGYKVPIQYSY